MSQNSPAMTMSQTSRAARPPPDSMVLAYGQSYQRVSRSCLSDAVAAVPWGCAAPSPPPTLSAERIPDCTSSWLRTAGRRPTSFLRQRCSRHAEPSRQRWQNFARSKARGVMTSLSASLRFRASTLHACLNLALHSPEALRYRRRSTRAVVRHHAW